MNQIDFLGYENLPIAKKEPTGVLNQLELPKERRLLNEVTTLIKMSLLNHQLKTSEDVENVDFSLDQQMLSIGLDKVDKGLSKMITNNLQHVGIESKGIYIKLIPTQNYNAFTLTNPIDGKLVLGINSGIVSDFPHKSLGFVIGHELGHHYLGHTKCNYKSNLEKISHDSHIFYRCMAISRRQEISADRFGLLCCGGDLDKALIALRNTTLQGTGKNIETIPDMCPTFIYYDAELDGYSPWLLSHPHMEIRKKALVAWQPVAKKILNKKKVKAKELKALNTNCEKLLIGMDHDDHKSLRVKRDFESAVNILEKELLDAHQTNGADGIFNSYPQAILFLKEMASPGKRIRILDWLVSVSISTKKYENIKSMLSSLAEDFEVGAAFKKRTAKTTEIYTKLLKQIEKGS